MSLENELEAEAFLNSLSVPEIKLPPEISLTSELSLSDEYIIWKNSEIIKHVDKQLIERLEWWDMSLSPKDMLAMKAEAFKQNRVIKWFDDGNLQLIPSNIIINIQNN